MEGGKPEHPEKHLSEQGENQQQTQPTYDAGSGNRTQATSVGGERSHRCVTLATPTGKTTHHYKNSACQDRGRCCSGSRSVVAVRRCKFDFVSGNANIASVSWGRSFKLSSGERVCPHQVRLAANSSTTYLERVAILNPGF